MCRNITTLRGLEPSATPQEIEAEDDAIGGYSCYQLLGQVSLILAENPLPQAVIIDCGIDDYSQGYTPTQIVANIDTMTQQLKAAGIKVIHTNILPSNNQCTVPAWVTWEDAINPLIASYAAAQTDAFIDVFTPTASATSHDCYKTGYSSDGTHPTAIGAYAMAVQGVNTLTGGTPNAELIPYLPTLPTDGFNLVTDATMSTGTAGNNSSSASGAVVPTGWQYYGSGNVPLTLVAGPDILGYWATYAATASNNGAQDILAYTISSGFVVGDTIAFSGRYKSSGTNSGGVSATIGVQFNGASLNVNTVSGFPDQSGTWYQTYTVPAGTTSITVSLGFNGNASGDTGTISVGQIGLLDFTQSSLGLAQASLNRRQNKLVNAANVFGNLTVNLAAPGAIGTTTPGTGAFSQMAVGGQVVANQWFTNYAQACVGSPATCTGARFYAPTGGTSYNYSIWADAPVLVGAQNGANTGQIQVNYASGAGISFADYSGSTMLHRLSCATTANCEIDIVNNMAIQQVGGQLLIGGGGTGYPTKFTYATTAVSMSGQGTATFAAGAAAGTSPGTPTCTTSHVCDSLSGTISFTTGSTTSAGAMLTVTDGVTRTNQPNCIGEAYLVASPYTALPVRLTYTTTTIVFNVGTAPTASTAYELVYAGCGGN